MTYGFFEIYLTYDAWSPNTNSGVYFYKYLLALFTTINVSFIEVFSVITSVYSVFFLKTNIINSIVFATKFLLLIALMIFIRGGIPRYRYDFLTKMGWVKFLSLILSIFLISLLLTFLY